MSGPREFLTCLLPELKAAAPDSSSALPEWINSYESLYKYSVENSEEFWSLIAKRRLLWFKEFDQVTNAREFNGEAFKLEWFLNGKLNVSGRPHDPSRKLLFLRALPDFLAFHF